MLAPPWEGAPWEGAPWTPRRWQAAALPEIVTALRGGARAVVSAIMGAGKSVLIAEVVATALRGVRPDQAVIVSCPTVALVAQLTDTMRARLGTDAVGQYYGRRKDHHRPVVIVCNPSVLALAAELAGSGRRVGLWVADEVHRSEAAQVRDAYDVLAPAAALGVTATPYRSSRAETLSIWDRVVVRYTMSDALRDGVLVPWDTVCWDGRSHSGDVDQIVIDLIESHGDGPGIVSAMTIADATAYAATLTGAGISSEAIHSRLSPGARAALLTRLEAGDLRCLVHVSLLAEGVDLPWLRWICLRRPVAARVRFIQELGRVLRCHPGKARAVVMDPHDLLGIHGISHPEAIGAAMEVEAGEIEAGAPPPPPLERSMPRAQAVDIITGWCRRVLLALQASGVAGSDVVTSTSWRHRPATDAQYRAVVRCVQYSARYLPDALREDVRAVVVPAVRSRLRRGAVSDLLSVMIGVRQSAQAPGWRWPTGLDVPRLDTGAQRCLVLDYQPLRRR